MFLYGPDQLLARTMFLCGPDQLFARTMFLCGPDQLLARTMFPWLYIFPDFMPFLKFGVLM
jgi:hypothetical protein